MTFLSAAEQRTLTAICEAFAPILTPERGDDPRLFALHAAQFDTAAHVENALELITTTADQGQIKIVLAALENPLFNQITAGAARGFSAMSPDQREHTLRAWAFSAVPMARQVFQMFKRLTLFLFYAVIPENGVHPAWEVMNYHPPAPVDVPRTMTPFTIDADTSLTTDALIVGSGAGGGVVAGELTAAGWDVIVAEKGGYYAERDFHGRELDSMRALYDKGGSLASKDLSMSILAGNALGGGTTINWSASLRTPDSVLQEWADDFGFTAATTPAYAASLDAIMARINVSEVESAVNHMNCLLEIGAQKLGYSLATIPRNTVGCYDANAGDEGGALAGMRCGFCGYGCRYGAKQGTLKTYLQDAHDRGARIIVGAYVEKVIVERGMATGAFMRVTDSAGHVHRVTVSAKIVVVAAGSVHTPALLLRSGLRNKHIGAHLHLHPVAPLYGVYDQPMRGWKGAPMSRLSAQFADLDGDGYGLRLEVAPLHPGIGALVSAWQSARQHRRLMNQIEYLSNILVLVRDKKGGRVTLDKQGAPVIDYRLSPIDAHHMMIGIIEGLRILHASGAREIASPHVSYRVYYPRPDAVPYHVENVYSSFEAYLDAVRAEGLRPNRFALLSAHQMSTARIAHTSALGAVDPTGQTYEVKNLYVTDSAAMPTPSGVNPMLTIMGLAHYLAGQIKARHRV